MKLTSISLANFRGYLDEKRIPFAPNLTIILGPNGFGKSTALDAFEWLLSGQISRYARRDEARREEFIRHVDASGEPYVEVEVEEAGVSWVLRRERRSRERSVLKTRRKDGSWLADTDILSFLLKIDRGVQTNSAKGHAFSDPFIAYHLLGQDTIQDFVRSEPRERYERLAPIIGVERYVTATEAMLTAHRELLNLFEESQRKLLARKADLEEFQTSSEGADLAIFESPEDVSISAELLAREYSELRGYLSNEHDRDLPQELPTTLAGALDSIARFLPDLELTVEASISSLQRRSALASSLKTTLSDLVEKRIELDRLKVTVEGNRVQFTTLRERAEVVRGRMEDLAARRNRLRSDADKLTKQQDECQALKNIRAQFAQLSEELQARETAYKRVEEDIVTTEKALTDCLSNIVRLTQLLERTKEGMSVIVSRIIPTERLLVESQSLLGSKGQAKNAQDTVDSLRQESRALSSEVARLRAESQQLQSAAAKAQEAFHRASESAKSYQQLLAQLRLYIDSPDCPVCGTPFQSREELLARIDERMRGENLELIEITNQIKDITKRLGDVGIQLEVSTQKLRRTETEIHALTKTADEWAQRMEALRDAAAELRLSLGQDIVKETEVIKDALLNSRQQEEKFRNYLAEHEASLASESDTKNSLELRMRELRVTGSRQVSEIDELKTKTVEIDRGSLQIARELGQMNLSPQAIEGRRIEIVNASAQLQKRLGDLQNEISSTEVELKSTEDQLEPLKLQRERLNKINDDLVRSEAEFLQGVRSLGLTTETYFTQLEEFEKGAAAEQSRLSEARSRLGAFVKTFNLAKRRVRSETHRARFLALNNEIAQLQRRCDTLAQSGSIAKLTAERVRQAGERRTERVLASCTSLAENYYNRMYPHPLWSKLELAVDADPSRGGRAQLSMSARRNHVVSEEVSGSESPRLNVKYSFSTGQLNLFALSLVLALAQLRKGELFNTILLDDPVQAMDDMRAAELCWILVQLSRTRQVVVTTGNQNFVDLLFQRAAPFKKEISIITHLFESMTSTGPELLLNWRTNDNEEFGKRVA